MAQKSRDGDEPRRALAVLHLWETAGNVSVAAERVCAARSTVYRWRANYETYGEAGLLSQRRGRGDWKASEDVLMQLTELVKISPRTLGYLRSRWSSELLAKELTTHGGIQVHASTVRRWLVRIDIRWRRARPTLHIRDPRKAERLQAINKALDNKEARTEVFYVDEVDVDLNPRIGPAWMARGVQEAIPTPGKNRKRYIAGALHARTGKVIWDEWERKNSLLFIGLLHKLNKAYRGAKRIILIVDNYIIHKSGITLRWLRNHPKFQLLFQPAYHPWVNRIERLWKALHDTVTRNHRCKTMDELMLSVRRFLEVSQPFPGNGHALAKL
jgi:transposase